VIFFGVSASGHVIKWTLFRANNGCLKGGRSGNTGNMNSPIPENTDVFQVVFHPAMRDALLQWADLCGYEIAVIPDEADPPDMWVRLPTYLAVLRSVPGRLAQRCTVCSMLVDIAQPGADHEIIYRVPLGDPADGHPFTIVHTVSTLEQSARLR
jgi:hypothetical protein